MTLKLSIIEGYLRGLKPDDIISVSEWAERYRILPDENARPGKFKMSLTPYNKEITDRLSVNDPAQVIVYKKSSQIGATETGNNWLGYVIDAAPAPFLYVMPTDAMMKKTSKTRVQKMIDSVERLRKKIKSSKAKDSGNTITEKYFEGGSVTMIGANSPVGLASTAIKFVYMDEIDRFPINVGGEGSALKLAETRTISFGEEKKIFITSTPTLHKASAIDEEFSKTGQRYYHVTCPFCAGKQTLQFDHLRWQHGKAETAKYECNNCNKLIPERHKPLMMDCELGNGIWVPKYPELENGKKYGYHINALYSPLGMYSWGMMAQDYIDSNGDIPKTIVFTNTKLGECYQPKEGDKPDWEALYNRYHNTENQYDPSIAFADTTLVTVGVDVQADRIEYMVVGWQKGLITQMLDYQVIVGNTDQQEVWDELGKVVNKTWVRADKHTIKMGLMAVDSGHQAKKVYDFVKKHQGKVVAVKGNSRIDMLFSAPKAVQVNKAGKKINDLKVYSLGVHIIKAELYGFLKQSINIETGEVPNGYCYVLAKEPNFYRGLVAEEQQLVKNKRGFDEYVWVKTYERNEPLDTFVYARGAAAIVGIDRWSTERWMRELLVSGTPIEATPPPTKPTEKKKSPFWDRN